MTGDGPSGQGASTACGRRTLQILEEVGQMRATGGSGRLGIVAAVIGLCLTLFASVGTAQTSTGSIRGSVRDEAGAPVSGATVTASGVNLGMVRTVTTGENGFYNLAGLRPDRYALTIRRIGFNVQGDSLTVGVGQTIQRDVRMRSATTQLESVVIVAAGTEGETRTSEVATNVTQEQINNLPTPDRSFISLAALAPGVTLQN